MATAENFASWEVVVKDLDSKDPTLTAHAEDAAGNVEGQTHVVNVPAVQ